MRRQRIDIHIFMYAKVVLQSKDSIESIEVTIEMSCACKWLATTATAVETLTDTTIDLFRVKNRQKYVF